MAKGVFMLEHNPALQDQANNEKSICILLRNQGIEPTALRVKIAAVLVSKIQHLTVTQIRDRLEHNNIMISSLAMTNTLRLFSRHNLIQEIIVDTKTVFYDSNTSNHSHFYNIESGNLVDIPTNNIKFNDSALSQIERKLSKW